MWLPISQPLDLKTTLESGQVFRWEQQKEWWIGFVSGFLVGIREHPGWLQYETTLCLGPEFIKQSEHSLDFENPLARFFRLDDDLSMVHQELSREPHLALAIQWAPGLRLLRQEPWECLISFICSTNSNISRIAGVVERMAKTFGSRIKLGDLEKYTFPTPAELARGSEEQLRTLGLGYRAPYVLRTAKIIAEGRLSLESLLNEDYEVAKDALLGLPGVGEKVADCVLLFALEQPTAFPIDVWIRRVLEGEYLLPKNLSYARLSRWAKEHFGPWAGYAQQYLYYFSRWGGKITNTEFGNRQ